MPGICVFKRTDGVWYKTSDCVSERPICPLIAQSAANADGHHEVDPQTEGKRLRNAFRAALNNQAFEFATNDILELDCGMVGSEELEAVYRPNGSAVGQKYKLKRLPTGQFSVQAAL